MQNINYHKHPTVCKVRCHAKADIKIKLLNKNSLFDLFIYLFFFFRYGITRFNEYFRRKEEFLALRYDN